jgi:multicomponent Na+:H+ antiporter subunit G
MTIIVAAFLVAGAFFLAVSSIGLLRLPDFYTRSHAVGKSETLGGLLTLTGLAILNGFSLETAKLFLIVFLIAVTNPTGIHTLSRAALRSGLRIWKRRDGGTGGWSGVFSDDLPIDPEDNS